MSILFAKVKAVTMDPNRPELKEAFVLVEKIELFVRDDGSKDKTIAILEKYQKEGKLKIAKGKNLGPARSFMELVYNIDEEFDFYSFSDQDDIWEENKIYNAVKQLEEDSKSRPCVYVSNQKILRDGICCESKKINRKMDFYASIVRNVAAGCTMVFNKKLLEYIKIYRPNYIKMHDVWIYKICECLNGKTIYDNNAYILYRQHGNNVEGEGNRLISKIKFRLKVIKNNDCERSNTANEILKGFCEI